MVNLSEIDKVISDAINNGQYSVEIDLSGYNTTPSTMISIPPLLESIKFKGNGNIFNFSITVDSINVRSKNLEIILEDLKANSGNDIFMNLGGNYSSNYNTTVRYIGGNNIITSEGHIGICVSNGKTVEFIGESGAKLIVNGGSNGNTHAYCAIGNDISLYSGNQGGHIIFSGAGTVIGNGGSILTPITQGNGVPGGFGIGFYNLTANPNSILIKCNAQVEAYGGTGQSSLDTDIGVMSSGDGGSAISLGVNGILKVDNCSQVTSSLIAAGGNAGAILVNDAQVNIANGGNGGSGISINSGTVDILGSAGISSGDGSGVGSDPDKVKPIQGGDGGNAINFTNSAPSAGPNYNTVKLGDNVISTSGDGGDSGVLINDNNGDYSLLGLNGGDGGSFINTSTRRTVVELGSVYSTSGSGGVGGSTAAYYDPADPMGSYVDGMPNPGKGGDNGAHITGGKISLNYTGTPVYEMGKPGNGGLGINILRIEFEGQSGNNREIIEATLGLTPHFGLINIARYMNFMFEPQFTQQVNLSSSVQQNAAFGMNQCININYKRVFFEQIFNPCLNIDCVNIQSNYDSTNAGFLIGNAILYLCINSTLTAYERQVIPVYTKLSSL